MDELETENLHDLLRQQESLREIIESISSELELRPLLTRIVRHACELIGADNGTIGLVDRERNLIRTEAAYRMPASELGAEMLSGIGLAGKVLETRQPLVLGRYGDVPHPTQPELAENPVIGLPIFWREEMIGFFGLGTPAAGQFTERDVHTLTQFARHAAIAIENARLFAGTQQAITELMLLYRTSRRISTAIDVEEVISSYLEQVAAQGRYACTVALYERNAKRQKTAVVVRGRWRPGEGMALTEIRLPYTQDALDPLLDAGQTVTIQNVQTDPRCSPQLREIQKQSQRPALAMVPLIVRGERTGLVILSYPAVYSWQEADLRPYQITAAQLATALESRRQALLLAQRSQQLAVLEERQRLARDLHDSVTQLLFSITLIAQSVSPAFQRSAEEGQQRVERILELSRSAHAELRALLAELRPPELLMQTDLRSEAKEGQWPEAREGQRPEAGGESFALVPSASSGIAEMLERLRERLAMHDLTFEVDLRAYHAQPSDVEETLARVAQESVNNIIKHAHASRVILRLTAAPEAVRLTVTDDGLGFRKRKSRGQHPKTNVPMGGFGLEYMRQRVESLEGTLQIHSISGKGTTIEVTLPCKEP